MKRSDSEVRSAKLDAQKIAFLLKEWGQRALLRGGNPYRARAYERAAESLQALTEPIGNLVDEARLTEIPGIGSAIADIVTQLHRKGGHPVLDEMRKDIPSSVLEMLSVPRLRAEKVRKLYKELGIASLQQLKKAADQGRLRQIKGFGVAFEQALLRGLKARDDDKDGRHIHRASELLEMAEKGLKKSPAVGKVAIAGDFRRGCELVRTMAIVAETRRKPASPLPSASSEVQVYSSSPEGFGAQLLFATGSAAHVEALQNIADQKGMSLSPEGLFKGKKLVAGKDERTIYAQLGLAFVPPELREDRGEIDLARRKKIPTLVKDSNLRGILHAHTIMSDGVNSLEEMAEGARARGYEYFGVADHSQSAHYARGLSLEEIQEQHVAINVLNESYKGKFRIFKGIEADILVDGALDYSDDVLARFDFVVASVHSRFQLSEEDQTERIRRAVANPHTTILGHMTGRQLLRRPGYEINIEKVLTECARKGVAVEINANPWRLDLDWRWHSRALQLGCLFSINPDAHSIRELDLVHWGVEMARKGGVPPSHVLNCLSLPAFAKHLERRRGKRNAA